MSAAEQQSPIAQPEPSGAPDPAALRRAPAGVRDRLLGPWPASLLLVIAVGAGLGNYLAARHVAVALQAAHALVDASGAVLSDLKDVETGERGFLISGQLASLAPYHAGLDRLGRDLAAVPDPQAAARLKQLAAAKTRLAAAAVNARRRSGLTAMLSASPDLMLQDKAAMDAVRAEVARIDAGERERIARVSDRDLARNRLLTLTAAAAAVLACALLAHYAWERRRREQAAGARLGGVLENAPVGLGFLDARLRVRHMNRALSEMSDRALGTAIGCSIWDVLPQLRAQLEPRLLGVLADGRLVPNINAEAVSAAGEARQFQMSFFALIRHGQSVVGRPGEIEGVGLVVQDVTARRRMEQRLQLSEKRFRSLITASTAIVWTTTATGVFDGAQPQWTAFTGQDERAMAELGWLDAVHPDDRTATVEAWSRAVTNAEPYAIEHRLRRNDGTWRWMAARATPIMDTAGVREWVGAHTDIHDRREAEHAVAEARDVAEEANRAKSQFIANMSHELRTPLSAVIGYSEMLEEEVEDLGATALLDDIGKIKSSARHLLSLINDVLDISKIEANRMTVYAEDFSTASLLHDVSATAEALVQRRGNRLVLDAPDDLGTMHTDQVKLRQCLFNLLSNAAKFTENGVITLTARREADWLTFRVDDSGIGMTAEQLDRLFQRFTQADASTTRRFGGSGLGLAITRAFAELLGGEVTVTSEAEHGSQFTLRIPAVLPEPAADVEAQADAPAPDGLPPPGECVLVIDDDAAQRDLLGRFLEREGFAVRSAADGRMGLALAGTLRPRAILLDVVMPGMDGWAVLSALKADPELASIPVVMVSFMREPGLGAALGAADFVTKPVEWDGLHRILERFREDSGDVLVVDDDADARTRIRSVLERDGWEVAEAQDGSDALRQVAAKTPRVILLDLMMPVMDGFAFLHELRERPGCAHIPVVVLTARDLSAEDRRKLGGADRVLSKGQTSLREISGQLRALAGAGGVPEPTNLEKP